MDKSTFIIVGHRGAAGLAPENTLASIRAALNKVIKYMEVDIQRSSDGVLVLMHDKTVNRTTNGKGKVANLSWRALQALDAGTKFSSEFSNEKIPSLESALALISQTDATLIIEVKHPNRFPGIVDELNNIIQLQNASSHVLVMSFNTKFLLELAEIKPNFPIGCIYLYPPHHTAPELQVSKFVSVNWLSAYFFPKRLRRLKEQGITVWAWTVNNSKLKHAIMKLGLNGIVTDFP